MHCQSALPVISMATCSRSSAIFIILGTIHGPLIIPCLCTIFPLSAGYSYSSFETLLTHLPSGRPSWFFSGQVSVLASVFCDSVFPVRTRTVFPVRTFLPVEFEILNGRDNVSFLFVSFMPSYIAVQWERTVHGQSRADAQACSSGAPALWKSPVAVLKG